MISTLRQLPRPTLLHTLRRSVGHIKNMNEENVRVIAEHLEHEPELLKTDRIYKPTYTIEFNREGEALIYSGNPIKNSTIYFKYPYIFCTHLTIQTNHSLLSPFSTTFSIPSNSCGTGTAFSCTSRPSSLRPGCGIGETSCTIPTNSSY